MKTDLEELAARARELEPSWDEVREQRVLASVRRTPPRTARRATLARVVLSAAAAAALLGAFAWWSSDRGETDRRSRLSLEDGSVCTLESGAQLSASERSPELIRLVQTRGRVRYVVSHHPGRTFEVIATPVTVRVRGTRFVVEVDPDVVTVTVEQGSVEVQVRSRITELGAGDELRVARHGAAIASRPERSSAAREREERERTSSGAASDRAIVAEREGESQRAGAARAPTAPARERTTPAEPVERASAPSTPPRRGARPARSPNTPTPSPPPASPAIQPAALDPSALLARADEHRRAGRLDDAIAVLELFLRDHGDDERASSAAFTLGRVRRQRGNHVGAAHAFARAHEEAPDGPLAEDSLAHEALSWSDAGDRTRAATAARRYLERYPVGLHANRMQLLAGP